MQDAISANTHRVEYIPIRKDKTTRNRTTIITPDKVQIEIKALF